MRTGCGGSSLRSDDFSLSVHTGFVFRSTRTGYCTSGSASRGSFADRHRAGRIEFRRKLPSFAAGSSVLDVTFEHGIPLGQLARVLRHPPLLIPPQIFVLEPLDLCGRKCFVLVMHFFRG